MDTNERTLIDETIENHENLSELVSSVLDDLMATAENDEERIVISFMFYLWLNAYMNIVKILVLSKYVKNKEQFILTSLTALAVIYNGIYKFIKNLPKLSDLILSTDKNPEELIKILEDMSNMELDSLKGVSEKEGFAKIAAIGPAAQGIAASGSTSAAILAGLGSFIKWLVGTAKGLAGDVFIPFAKFSLVTVPLKVGDAILKYGPSTIFYAGTAAFGIGSAASLIGWFIYKTWKDNVGVGAEKLTSKGFTEKVNRDISRLSNELLTRDLKRFRQELQTHTSEIYGEDEFIPDVPPDIRKLKIVTFKRNPPPSA
ncbi:MAG: hypothetical protein QXT77_04305 [Candidatus Methanomethylicaceae archaeon]